MIFAFIDSKRRFQPTADRPLTFTIKGRHHALALEWDAFPTEAEARAHAKKAKKPSFFFIKDARQAGFTTHADHRRGQEVQAAAAMIARKIGRTPKAAGIYALEGNAHYPDPDTWFWIVEIEDGKVTRDEVVEKPEAVLAAADYLARPIAFDLIIPEEFQSGEPSAARIAAERLGVALDPKFACPLIVVSRDFSALRRLRLGQVSAWWVIAAIALTAGTIFSFGWFKRSVEIRTVTKEVVVQQERLYVPPTRAIPDPAAFLVACDQAYAAAAPSLPAPTMATVTCTAPSGTSAGWTLSLVQMGASSQTHTVTLTLAPHQLIPSGPSGIPSEQVFEAIKRALPPTLVTVTSKAVTQTLSSATAAKPAAAANTGTGPASVIPPGGLTTGTGSPTPAAAPKADSTTTRTLVQVTLTSPHNPRSWAASLARTPFAVESVTRDPKGVWSVTGRIL